MNDKPFDRHLGHEQPIHNFHNGTPIEGFKDVFDMMTEMSLLDLTDFDSVWDCTLEVGNHLYDRFATDNEVVNALLKTIEYTPAKTVINGTHTHEDFPMHEHLCQTLDKTLVGIMKVMVRICRATAPHKGAKHGRMPAIADMAAEDILSIVQAMDIWPHDNDQILYAIKGVLSGFMQRSPEQYLLLSTPPGESFYTEKPDNTITARAAMLGIQIKTKRLNAFNHQEDDARLQKLLKVTVIGKTGIPKSWKSSLLFINPENIDREEV